MTWWLAVCAFLAAVATFLDLRSTHVGVGLGLKEVGKLARKWGLTTLTVINVAGWLVATIGGAVIDDPQVSGACALVLLLMTLAHVRVWQANAEKIDIEIVERGTRRVG